MQADSPDEQTQMTDDNSEARPVGGDDSKPQTRSENENRQQIQTVGTHTQINSASGLATTENSKHTTPTTEYEDEKDGKFECFLEQVKASFQEKQKGQKDEQIPWLEKLRTDLSSRFGSATGRWKITNKNWSDCSYTENLKGNNNAMKDCGKIEYTNGQGNGMIMVKYTWQGSEDKYEWELKVSGGSGSIGEYKEVVDRSKKVRK